MAANRKLGMVVANGLVALALLLGAGAAQAATIVFSDNNAIAIMNLQVGDTLYDVVFRQDTAENIYGAEPDFDFTTSDAAQAAMEAVNAALNSEPDVMSVGPAFDIVYEIPFEIFGEVQGAPFVSVREALYFDEPNVDLGTPAWLQGSDPQARPFLVPKTFADFTVVPEPGSALLLGLGLAALGAIGRSRRAESGGTSASRIG